MTFYSRILLLVTIFLCSERLFAQKTTDASFKRFGFFAGINAANMNFNKGFPVPAVRINPSWKSGVTIGLLLRIALTKNISVQPEYAYTQRRGADKSLGIKYSIDYLSLPVLVCYRITDFFAVVAGPQVELLIHAKEITNGVNSNLTHGIEERSIGITGGARVQINESFFLSARYLNGLNHINVRQPTMEKEFKYEVVNLTAGVQF